MRPNTQETADLVTFTKWKTSFFCSVRSDKNKTKDEEITMR